MSKGPVMVSAEETAKNKAFMEQMAASGTERYIRRHSKQARWTHGITIIACILLCISGLFVFVPALAAAVGADTVFAIRMSHRVLGVIFVLVPLISAIMAPKGVKHIFKNLFDRWDSDDKKWMMLFFPYLFMAKWIHMPDQREVKSGQRFADGMLWFSGALMGITGVFLLLGTTLFDFGGGVYGVMLFLHDIGFLLIAVFGLAHIFLGAGNFQPYRGTAKLMFGDGTVSIAGTTETAYALAGYKKEKYRNTEFQLKYTQTTGEGNDYGAIIWSFENSVTNLPWNSGGVMIAFENGKATLYARGDAGLIAKTTSGLTLDNGKTYDISLSVCQIAANQLRVIVKVDGAEWFNEVYTDSKLANTAGYFCFGGINTASVTIEKTGKAVVPDPEPEPTYDVVDVTELLADTKNWTTGWNKALTFENGSVTADGDLSSTYSVGGYNGKTYKNTIFRFKYTRTRYADDGYDGFTLGSGPDNVYWGAGGIYVDFNKDSAVLRCIGKDKQAVFVTTEVPSLNDGQSYNIEFGIIDVNESTVKVILKINGKTYFEKELTNSDFVGEEFYFGIIAVKSKATISKPDAK